MSFEANDIAGKIQSTLISNTLTAAQWEAHINDCLRYRFQAAMIPGAWVKRTADALRASGIKVASFVDFAYGTMTTRGKAQEAESLVKDGAQEVDLMPNIGFLLSGMESEFLSDIRAVVNAVPGTPVKIMLELPLLNPQQRERAVALSLGAGVAWLKNASGGAVGVAIPADIRFLRQRAPAHIGIKASGGVKSLQQARELINAGAGLLGTSAASQIMGELLHGQAIAESGDTY